MLNIFYRMLYKDLFSSDQSFNIPDIKNRKYAAHFLASGLTRLAELYITEHETPDAEEIAQIAYSILSASIYYS